MKTIYYLLSLLFLMGCFSCQEEKRFEISGDDIEAPNPPEFLSYKPLVGGARLFYNLPPDKDVLSVNAEYVTTDGKLISFAASYFVDSLDVMGIGDTNEHVIQLYAMDRAGNKSASVPVTVSASESALENVTQSLKVLPAFNSFIVSWENELMQAVNIYVDMVFNKGGQKRDISWVLTSKEAAKREVIDDVVLEEGETLTVSVRVGDTYGNMTPSIDMGEIRVMSDEFISKDKWRIPNANDSIAGVPMCFGEAYECKSINVIDGIISRGKTMNIMHTAERGRTGRWEDGNLPWNFLIDLGDYYELSRIVTNQRHDLNTNPYDDNVRGYYYMGENINRYNMYYLDEATNEWVLISQHTIEVPVGLSQLEFAKQGAAGDMALMYPDAPTFTKRTRWFRYEALGCFSGPAMVLSEITLYGRKAN